MLVGDPHPFAHQGAIAAQRAHEFPGGASIGRTLVGPIGVGHIDDITQGRDAGGFLDVSGA
jgi:hypothetical protein